jgi:hypothetical protein
LALFFVELLELLELLELVELVEWPGKLFRRL